MTRRRRRVVSLLAALVAALWTLSTAVPALGHAELVASTPSGDAKVAASPDAVTLTFSEPISLLDGQGIEILAEDGAAVGRSGRVSSSDARVLEAQLEPDLPDGTYTVRYRIVGADSHIIPGMFVFGVGPGALAEPYLGERPEGPSETSAWSVSARFIERVALGGLLGVVAFRLLVWAPAARRLAGFGDEREAVLAWGRDTFWVTFGVLAVVAMVAEAYLLVVQSAGALGVSVAAALTDATGVSRMLGNTRFGTLVQLRGALLFVVFAVGAVLFLRECGSADHPRPARPGSGPVAMALLVAPLLAVIGAVAAQGHANVASDAALQIGVQLVHIASVSLWVAGLALVIAAVARLPRVAETEGPAMSAYVLARFSRVALVLVAVAVATGVVRSVSELGGLSELWETAYGRSILYKVALLAPIGVLALYNRRIVTALRRVKRPNRPTLRLVRRAAVTELGLSVVVIVVASVLVAQVPGGA